MRSSLICHPKVLKRRLNKGSAMPQYHKRYLYQRNVYSHSGMSNSKLHTILRFAERHANLFLMPMNGLQDLIRSDLGSSESKSNSVFSELYILQNGANYFRIIHQ